MLVENSDVTLEVDGRDRHPAKFIGYKEGLMVVELVNSVTLQVGVQVKVFQRGMIKNSGLVKEQEGNRVMIEFDIRSPKYSEE